MSSMISRIIDDTYCIITVPSIDEILDDKFSCPKYIEEEFTKSLERVRQGNKELSDEELKRLQSNSSDEYINKIRIIRDILLEKVMLKYEDDISKGNLKEDIYTKHMKEIAQKYKKLKNQIIQKDRIKKYNDKIIPLRDLHFEDIKHIKLDRKSKIRVIQLIGETKELSKSRKEFNKKLESYTLGQLTDDYLESKGKTR
ncbi:MAG: hypothetical protein IKE90_00970 [Bacilli bacterium]|nr:hypothetical protein [Bacilli bacterium]